MRVDASGWHRIAGRDGLEVWRGPGEGPAVVAAHGIEDSWRTWLPALGRLTGHTVYSLQLPWCSGNDYRWRERDTPGAWLGTALDLLPEPPTVLLGHSFGANAVLQHLATADPLPELAAVALVTPFYRPVEFSATADLRTRSLAAFRRALIDGLRLRQGVRVAKLEPEISFMMTTALLERVVPSGFPVFFAEFLHSGRIDLGRVGVPTLVLGGTRDEGLTPVRAAALAAAMPAATVRLHEEYGHFCHAARADEVATEITGFLERHRPTGGPTSATPQEGDSVPVLLDGEPTSYVGAPRYEGANIRTWIGFKHFMYLVEEAVLQYFRERGVGPHDLYHRHGLGLEIIDSSVQLPTALDVDDQVYATVVGGRPKPDQGAQFVVDLAVERPAGTVTVLKGKVRVALVAVKDGAGTDPVPAFLAPYVVSEVDALPNAESATLAVPAGAEIADVLAPPGSGSYLWSWRAPYYYCHFSDRLQHSAYVRTLEEVVDRFLDARGLAIGALLVERAWIPVVSRARVQVLADLFMEETVHTVFTVSDILKDTMYTARMDCYVRRGDRLVRTATASIVHGYAISRGERAGTVATLDAATQAALLGRSA